MTASPITRRVESSAPPAESGSYTGPFAAMTALFFMWGFMMTWNDLLIPRFKEAFTLNFFQAMLVQFAFNGAYFAGALIYYVCSRIAGDPIGKIGYKNAVIVGLLLAATGSALFYPASIALSYPLFLASLFVIGLGFAMLQIAANPYVSVLGPESTASSRLNLAQGFNSIGTTIGPVIGGWLIFVVFARAGAHGAEAVRVPYLCCSAVFLLLALVFARLHLPALAAKEIIGRGPGALSHLHTVLGVVAIFMYVGSEVAIGSSIVSFLGLPRIAGLSHALASRFLAFYWGGLMVGRFMGAFSLSSMRPARKWLCVSSFPVAAFIVAAIAFGWSNASHYGLCLAVLLIAFVLGASNSARMISIFSIALMALLSVGALASGATAQWAILGAGLFCSVMWSNIFSLAIEGLGPLKSQASSLLIMAILGAALIPPLQGALADRWGIQAAYLVPIVSMSYVAFYGLYGHRAGRRPELSI